MQCKGHLSRLVPAALSAIIIATFTGCSGSPTTLIAMAAGGAKPAMDDIGSRWNQEFEPQLIVSYGGGGELLQQMQYGRVGDIFIAPEQAFMDMAVSHNLIDAETIVNVAYMIPAIAVARGNPHSIHSLADLAIPGLRIAMTRPETTLLGRLAPEIFKRAGLSEAINTNITAYASDPNNLMYLIATGNIDAGITWHFYQSYDDKLEIIFLEPDQVTGIGEMLAAVNSASSNKDDAARFIDFLISEAGQAIFQQHGYITDHKEVSKYWNR